MHDKLQDGDPSCQADLLAAYVIDATHDTAEQERARIEREHRLLRGSGYFDADWYLRHHKDVARSGTEPLRHFCTRGWRQLRNPSADFDVWWYWASHLDPAHEATNPLVHYALVGHAAGLDTRPGPYQPDSAGQVLPPERSVRRACLFAGHDPDGIIDECVVAYVRELSRYADVWYLADDVMQPGELEKLADVTRCAWAVRHGAYDFGSWSLLAREKLGWNVLAAYDEVLLVNDSCYLLRPLDHVFARMDTKPCDWWGMQATKGLFSTRHQPANQFRQPIPMDDVRRTWLPRYAAQYPYDFHVGSYFLALRKPVIADHGFRRRLDAVVPQVEKANIVRKYEIGIGQYLMAAGHVFETFIDRLYPFHPLYTDTAFDLLAEGFPLLKRYLLAENPYRMSQLVDWKRRVPCDVPDAPVDRIEYNLRRVSNYPKLYSNLRLIDGPLRHPVRPQLLTGRAFAQADRATPTFDHWWAFPVCAFTQRFTGNERALFEAVKDDPSIKKIVLAREKYVSVDGENVVVAPLHSRDGQDHLMRARQIFIKHSPTRNIGFPVSPVLHNIINLWHGVPLKRIGYASLDMQGQLRQLAAEHRRCRAVIAASHVDALAMASAFYPLSRNDVWVTGLPRHDFIMRPFGELPAHLREQSMRLERWLDGRRLVLFAPTFRHAKDAYYKFSDTELAWLQRWLEQHHAILGVREHMADTARVYLAALGTIGALNLSDTRFADVEVLYRHATVLLTDYSSCFVDFMLTGRPMCSFAYDFDRYVHAERGLFYDMHQVFPGPVCCNFRQLQVALEKIFDRPGRLEHERYTWQRRLLLEHLDDDNAWRVAQKVKGLYGQDPVAEMTAG